jgi:hypothetical protein
MEVRPNLILQPTVEITPYQEFKDKALKCKVIALSKLNYPPITTNPTDLPARVKRRIMSIMEEYMIKPLDEVDEEFNEIVNDDILGSNSKYEEYSVATPVLPPS